MRGVDKQPCDLWTGLFSLLHLEGIKQRGWHQQGPWHLKHTITDWHSLLFSGPDRCITGVIVSNFTFDWFSLTAIVLKFTLHQTGTIVNYCSSFLVIGKHVGNNSYKMTLYSASWFFTMTGAYCMQHVSHWYDECFVLTRVFVNAR